MSIARDFDRSQGQIARNGTDTLGFLLGSLLLVVWNVLKQPVVLIPAAIAGGLWWLGGWGAVALFGILALTIPTVWLMLDAKSFHRFVWRPARGALRRLCVYQPRWERVMRGCKLATVHKRSESVPKLKHVRSDKTTKTDRLLVKLLDGQSPEDVAKVAEGIRHSYRADSCRVRPGEKPGQAEIILRKGEPLADIIPALPIPEEPDLERTQVGITEDGEPWSLSVRGANHLLLAGVTGAGKSSVLWALMRGLAPAIRDGLVALWVVDPKGGSELGPGEPMYERFENTNPQKMATLLEDAVKLMEARQARMYREGIRTFEPSPGDPVVIVVVDEVALLSAYTPDKNARDKIAQALATLLTQGRAPGVVVIAALQDPRKEVLNLRNLFPNKVGMQLDEAVQVDMVLGPGSRERGALCDQIPDSLRGVGYVRVNGSREPVRVRAAYVSDADIAEMVERYAPRKNGDAELSPEVIEALRAKWEGPKISE